MSQHVFPTSPHTILLFSQGLWGLLGGKRLRILFQGLWSRRNFSWKTFEVCGFMASVNSNESCFLHLSVTEQTEQMHWILSGVTQFSSICPPINWLLEVSNLFSKAPFRTNMAIDHVPYAQPWSYHLGKLFSMNISTQQIVGYQNHLHGTPCTCNIV